MEPTTNNLAKNVAYFETMRSEWLRTGLEGKWVTIVDEKLVGHFDTPAAAYQAGVTATGATQNFLIKQVASEDEPRASPALLMGAILVDR